MKKIIVKIFVSFFLFLCLGINSVLAQNRWDSLAGASKNPENLGVIYADSNYIYAAGSYTVVGGIPMNNIARWNGVKWDSMGGGIGGITFNPSAASAFATYHNKLYVGGIFGSLGNVLAVSLGTWDGVVWDSIPIQPFKDDNDKGVGAMAVINDKLYIGGIFDTVAGQPNVFDIACWNGINWSSLNFPNLRNFEFIDALCEYNGSIYAAGDFYGNVNDTIGNILRWDGTSWHSVGGGITDGDYISSMVVYNGALYVAGLFSKSDGDVGNNIQRWDGTSWSDVGGGTDYQIFSLLVYKSKLYALGNFDEAGGVPATSIAEWDGSKWCGLGDTFNNSIISGCVYKDSLYIGGGFGTIDSKSTGDMAEWVGGSYVSACGNDATSVNEPIAKSEEVSAYPNPSNGSFTLSLSNINAAYTVEIYNVLGEKVYTETLPQNPSNNTINLTGQPSGVYLYRVLKESGELVGSGKLAIEK